MYPPQKPILVSTLKNAKEEEKKEILLTKTTERKQSVHQIS